jgi:hypothetical protein
MSQTRKQSLAEACVGTALGFGVAVISNAIVLPAFGHQTTLHDNISIAIIFTGISLVRAYYLRRFFNWWHHKRLFWRKIFA